MPAFHYSPLHHEPDRLTERRGPEGLGELRTGMLLVLRLPEGGCVAVLAAPDCDPALVAQELARLAQQCGLLFTPALRVELQAALPGRAPCQPSPWLPSSTCAGLGRRLESSRLAG